MKQILKLSLLSDDPHLREMIVGSAIGMSVKVLSAVSILFMNIVIARFLGANETGLFFLAFTLVTIIAAVGRLGFDQSIIRFVAAARENNEIDRLHGVYRKSISWVAIASICLAVLASSNVTWLVENYFPQPGFEPVLRSFLIAIPLIAVYTMLAQAMQGLKKIAKSLLTLNVLMPIALLLLMLLDPVYTAEEAAGHFILASLFALCSGLYFWHQSAPKTEKIKSFSSSQLWKTSTPLWAVVILSQVVQWTSQLMLGAWSSAENVAFFATAQRTAMLTSFVLFAVNAIAAPKFAALHEKGDIVGLKRIAIWSVRLMMLVAAPILMVMLLFPDWLMSFFGDEFRAASTALMILAIGQFINIATGSVGYLLSMTGREREVLNNTLVSAVVAIALGVILIPSYGLLGAALATATAVASQNLMGVYQVRKHLGFNTLVFWK
jgi:O-antigen/teichoic acid export membrane protein